MWNNGDYSPLLPQIFIFLPNTTLTSPHADTGHETLLSVLIRFHQFLSGSNFLHLETEVGSSGIQIIDYRSFLNIPRLIPNLKRSSSRFQTSDDGVLFKETIFELFNPP